MCLARARDDVRGGRAQRGEAVVLGSSAVRIEHRDRPPVDDAQELALLRGHPAEYPGRGSHLRDPLIFPYEINKTKPFLNGRLALEKFARWRALN